MHAAKPSRLVPFARRPETARRSAQPRARARQRVAREPAAVAAATYHAKRSCGCALGIQLAARGVMRAEYVVDGVVHPLLDIARQVVDAVRRATQRIRADGRELGEPVAVVGDVLQGQHGGAVVAEVLVVKVAPGKSTSFGS